MHHSRDTAKKQWCETQVLVMAGVSRVFSIKKANLEELGEYENGVGTGAVLYISTANATYRYGKSILQHAID